MRTALVHDWLTGMRGGERVLHQLALMYPDADLHTLVHVPGSTTSAIETRRIEASFLDGWPGVDRHYRKYLPLFPIAARRLHLEGYDLIISVSHAVAKSVRTDPGSAHLDYCLTPMRYVWDQADAYLGRGAFRLLASPLVAYLRRFDRRHSGPDEVTRFVGISRAVASRIERHYGREASVVHPPVEVERFTPVDGAPEDFHLMVGGFVPYKREDLAIEAFRGLDARLVVVGDGPSRARLEASAPPNVQFTGRVLDAELGELMARCRALIYPQEEDFGIAAVEAQAAGRPVVAFAGGGALDTVRPLAVVDHEGEILDTPMDGATGVFFSAQEPACLAAAVLALEDRLDRFDAKAIRTHAETFGVDRFRRQIADEIALTLARSA